MRKRICIPACAGRRKKKSLKAFTLAETLIAMAVMVFAFTVAVGAIATAVECYRSTVAEAEADVLLNQNIAAIRAVLMFTSVDEGVEMADDGSSVTLTSFHSGYRGILSNDTSEDDSGTIRFTSVIDEEKFSTMAAEMSPGLSLEADLHFEDETVINISEGKVKYVFTVTITDAEDDDRVLAQATATAVPLLSDFGN